MKKVFFVAVIFSITFSTVMAQEVASLTGHKLSFYNTLSSPTFDQDVVNPPGYKMMKVGKGLTIGGGILLIGGIVLMSTADESYYYSTTSSYGTEESGDPKFAFGMLATIGGVGMIIPGAILWSKGGKKYKAYQQTQTSLSLGVSGNGAGLRYRF